MKIKRVEPTLKEQPRAKLLVATAKIVEALDPLYSSERRQAMMAALAILGEETLLKGACEAGKQGAGYT